MTEKTALTRTLPAAVWPGRGTACYIRGFAWADTRLESLQFETVNPGIRLSAWTEPNYPILNDCCKEEHAEACLMSGFTGIVHIEGNATPGDTAWELSAHFTNNRVLPIGSGNIRIDATSVI